VLLIWVIGYIVILKNSIFNAKVKMTNTVFPKHGNIQTDIDRNLVKLNIIGPCNLEFIQDMEEQMIALRPQLDLANYAGLIVLHGEALATPEALNYFTNYLKTVKAKAVALCVKSTFNPSITQKVLTKAYGEAGINHKFFEDEELAVSWLRHCIK